MNFISHAQNFEDVVLWRALHDVRDGRYLDIGAQDPELDSVSLAFYERGWRGIHVEPTPFYASRLREARPDETVIQAVVTDAAGPIDFYEISQTGISTGRSDIARHHSKLGYQSRKIVAVAIRLDELLEMAKGDLHWMKIDVEGMEADVLRSWGKSSVRPWVLVIESTYPNTQEQTTDQWIEEVQRRGYEQVLFDGLSCYFVHEQHRDLAPLFAAPANIFDRFDVGRNHFSAGHIRTELEETERRLAGETSHALELGEQLHGMVKERDDARQEQAKAIDAKLAADQQHGQREDRLNDELREVASARDSVQRELNSSLERLVVAEQHHRVMVARQSREREILEQQYRERQDQRLRQLREAELATAVAQVEAARFEERALSLQKESDEARARLLQAEQSCTALAAEIEQLRLELRERMSQAEQASAAFVREIEQLRASRSRAGALIRRLECEPRGRWQRIGEALRLARRSQALGPLVEWSRANGNSGGVEFAYNQPSMTGTLSIMQFAAVSGTANPYLRADSLAELLAWSDVDFVRCAYVTMLGRQPDPDGEAHYTNNIRNGHSKLEVLWQLRRSSEGRDHDPGIAGLDRELKRAALGRKAFIGWLVRIFTGTEPNDRQTKRWRSLSNSIECLKVTQQRQFGQVHSRLESLAVSPERDSFAADHGNKARDNLAGGANVLRLSNRARDVFAAMANVR